MPLPAGYHYVKGSKGREVVSPDGEVMSRRQAENRHFERTPFGSMSGFQRRKQHPAYQQLAKAARLAGRGREVGRSVSPFEREYAAALGNQGGSYQPGQRLTVSQKDNLAAMLGRMGAGPGTDTWRRAWFSAYSGKAADAEPDDDPDLYDDYDPNEDFSDEELADEYGDYDALDYDDDSDW